MSKKESELKFCSIINIAKNMKSIDTLISMIESSNLVPQEIKNQANDARQAQKEIKNEITNNSKK